MAATIDHVAVKGDSDLVIPNNNNNNKHRNNNKTTDKMAAETEARMCHVVLPEVAVEADIVEVAVTAVHEAAVIHDQDQTDHKTIRMATKGLSTCLPACLTLTDSFLFWTFLGNLLYFLTLNASFLITIEQ